MTDKRETQVRSVGDLKRLRESGADSAQVVQSADALLASPNLTEDQKLKILAEAALARLSLDPLDAQQAFRTIVTGATPGSNLWVRGKKGLVQSHLELGETELALRESEDAALELKKMGASTRAANAQAYDALSQGKRSVFSGAVVAESVFLRSLSKIFEPSAPDTALLLMEKAAELSSNPRDLSRVARLKLKVGKPEEALTQVSLSFSRIASRDKARRGMAHDFAVIAKRSADSAGFKAVIKKTLADKADASIPAILVHHGLKKTDLEWLSIAEQILEKHRGNETQFIRDLQRSTLNYYEHDATKWGRARAIAESLAQAEKKSLRNYVGYVKSALNAAIRSNTGYDTRVAVDGAERAFKEGGGIAVALGLSKVLLQHSKISEAQNILKAHSGSGDTRVLTRLAEISAPREAAELYRVALGSSTLPARVRAHISGRFLSSLIRSGDPVQLAGNLELIVASAKSAEDRLYLSRYLLLASTNSTATPDLAARVRGAADALYRQGFEEGKARLEGAKGRSSALGLVAASMASRAIDFGRPDDLLSIEKLLEQKLPSRDPQSFVALKHLGYAYLLKRNSAGILVLGRHYVPEDRKAVVEVGTALAALHLVLGDPKEALRIYARLAEVSEPQRAFGLYWHGILNNLRLGNRNGARASFESLKASVKDGALGFQVYYRELLPAIKALVDADGRTSHATLKGHLESLSRVPSR